MDGESNRGRQSQSIEPTGDTSANTRPFPTTPWSKRGDDCTGVSKT